MLDAVTWSKYGNITRFLISLSRYHSWPANFASACITLIAKGLNQLRAEQLYGSAQGLLLAKASFNNMMGHYGRDG